MTDEPSATSAATALIGVQSATPARTRRLATSLTWGLALLLAVLPFELNAGVLLAGLTFTNVELLALAVLGLWGALLVSERRSPAIPRKLALPAVALLVVFLMSVAIAPAWRGAALKFTMRQAQGVLLACCLADQISAAGWPLVRRLGLALVAGASASAALGMLELSESAPVFALLAIFKEQPVLVGGLLRLSATFGYANIAAMYYEAVLPLVLVAIGLASGWRGRWLCVGSAFLLYSAALLTYSRAALLAATAAVLIVALAAIRVSVQKQAVALETSGLPRALPRRGRAQPPLRRVIGLCLGLLAIALGLLLFSPSFRVRIAEPDVDRWYRADYTIARLPALAPNAVVQTPITVINRGLVTWYPGGLRPVVLAYHWLDAQTRLVVRYNGERTPLPLPVEPGEMITLDAAVRAPNQPGTYILVWDMVAEHSSWFSARGSPVAEVAVVVAGTPALSQPAPALEPAGLPQRITALPSPPDRRQLWVAALRLWRTYPLLGIGPDVFRHVYGPELGLSEWDDRVHTNNLYLELLVGAGIAGLAAFLTLVGAALLAGWRILARPANGQALLPSRRWWMALGCVVGLAVYLIHGALDMFLEYTATYLLFWALIGALHGLTAIDHDGDAKQA